MKPLFLAALLALSISCESQLKARPVSFPVHGSEQLLLGLSSEAVSGKLDFSQADRLEYEFASPPAILPPVSLEIAYSLKMPLETSVQPVLKMGDNVWALPIGDSNNGFYTDVLHYAIPVSDPIPQHFAIAFFDSDSMDFALGTTPVLQIHSVSFRERWYGFSRERSTAGENLHVSPFVDMLASNFTWTIDLYAAMAVASPSVPTDFAPVITADLIEGAGAVLDAGNRRFVAAPHLTQLHVPWPLFELDERPLVLSGNPTASFRVSYVQMPHFPAPIAADPGLILAWPQEHWRNDRYEVFRWDRFPSLLIFDTANYAVQNRMLKRLAFFVEKKDFRGRLAFDEEIADLHGWNAHDYRAIDLARFFQAAHDENFPLLPEERELEQILLNEGIIRNVEGKLQAGEGAILSLSRETPDFLRERFIVHESFHGLFFIDKDFELFSRERWEQFPQEAKRFLVSFFRFREYDPDDEYLMVKEFKGHILQQPISEAARYFGANLPSRLEANPDHRDDLPQKDRATNSWPSLAAAFAHEAHVFSDYVESRWGFSAGLVHSVTVLRRP